MSGKFGTIRVRRISKKLLFYFLDKPDFSYWEKTLEIERKNVIDFEGTLVYENCDIHISTMTKHTLTNK
jgi:hypothetical protein